MSVVDASAQRRRRQVFSNLLNRELGVVRVVNDLQQDKSSTQGHEAGRHDRAQKKKPMRARRLHAHHILVNTCSGVGRSLVDAHRSVLDVAGA